MAVTKSDYFLCAQILLEKRMDNPPEVMTRPLPQFIPEVARFGHLDNQFTRQLSSEEYNQLQNVSTKSNTFYKLGTNINSLKFIFKVK